MRELAVLVAVATVVLSTNIATAQTPPAPAVPTACPPLKEVTSAVWFSGAKKADVTVKVKELVAGGQYKIEARNNILGADPAPGTQKQLTVTYVDGKCTQVTKTVTERQFFEF